MNFCEKFFDLDKTQFFYNLLKTFKFAAILVHHSSSVSSVSRDVGIGTRDLGRDLPDVKTSGGILLQICLRNKAYNIVKDSHTTYVVICTQRNGSVPLWSSQRRTEN